MIWNPHICTNTIWSWKKVSNSKKRHEQSPESEFRPFTLNHPVDRFSRLVRVGGRKLHCFVLTFDMGLGSQTGNMHITCLENDCREHVLLSSYFFFRSACLYDSPCRKFQNTLLKSELKNCEKVQEQCSFFFKTLVSPLLWTDSEKYLERCLFKDYTSFEALKES